MQKIYSSRSRAEEDRRGRPQAQGPKSPPAAVVGAVFSEPQEEKPRIPDIVPMRRGRPGVSPKPPTQQPAAPRKVAAGDPFAALDSNTSPRSDDPDDISARFPSLDQFSLLHDQGGRFEFEPSPAPTSSQPASDLSQRVSERLADEAFASPKHAPQTAAAISRPQTAGPVAAARSGLMSPPIEPALSKVSSARSDVNRAQAIISSNPELKAISASANSKYVSTGTMTGESLQTAKQQRSDALPREAAISVPTNSQSSELRSLATPAYAQNPARSRMSLDDQRPNLQTPELLSSRTLNLPGRSRPVSSTFEPSTLDYLRERESSTWGGARSGRPSPLDSPQMQSPNLQAIAVDDKLEGSNDPSYMKGMDDLDSKPADKGKTSKRSSLTSLSGTKNILAGKFGDAFKRFETHGSSPSIALARTPSPLKELDRRDLTPIAGSEATDGRTDDGHNDDDEESMTPEARRDLERRRLLEEERRVEAAQAEYRKRMADGGPNTGQMPLPKSIGGVPRAVSIQNRVQTLLSDDSRPPSVQRTAQGYGKYSDAATAASKVDKPTPDVPRKPLNMPKVRAAAPGQGQGLDSTRHIAGTSSAPPALSTKPTGKPMAPRKPVHLNSIPTGGGPTSPLKPRSQAAAAERLVAADLPGQPVLDMSAQQRDDYIDDFSKRFPSLSSIEMVEREIGGAQGDARR